MSDVFKAYEKERELTILANPREVIMYLACIKPYRNLAEVSIASRTSSSSDSSSIFVSHEAQSETLTSIMAHLMSPLSDPKLSNTPEPPPHSVQSS